MADDSSDRVELRDVAIVGGGGCGALHARPLAIAPETRAPRTGERRGEMEALPPGLGLTPPTAGPALFVCRHRVFGVGMFDAAEVLAGDRLVAEAGSGPGEVDVLV